MVKPTLKIVRLSSFSCKKTLLKSFDPEKDSWVVSDLKTKLFLNKELLKDREIIFSEPVKRASELWQNLLKSTLPDVKTVGPIGEWALAKNFLEERKDIGWAQRPKAVQRLIKATRELATLFAHPMASEIISEFDSKFGDISQTFTEILKLSYDYFLFCDSQGLAPRWLAPVLLTKYPERLPSGGKYFFDLGFELVETERDLIQELSLKNDVTVMCPDFLREQHDVYKNLGLGKLFEEQTLVEEALKLENSENKIKTWKCASFDSEARAAVEQVNLWINSGAKSSEICIVGEDISIYENILSHDLKWQGLGIQRDLSSPVASHETMRILNAKLKIISGKWSITDVFEAYPEISKETKKKLNPALSQDQIFDLKIRSWVLELEKLNSGKMLSFSDFEKIIIKIFDSSVIFLQPFILKFLTQLRLEMGWGRFEFHQWCEAWQKACVSGDIVYKDSDFEGVWTLDFNSCEEVPAKYFIFLGLSESKTKRRLLSELSTDELKFFKDAGFYFEPRVLSWTEMAQWFVKSQGKNIILSYSETDHDGAVYNPSSLWLNHLDPKNEALRVAQDLTWVSVQRHLSEDKMQTSIDEIKKWPQGYTKQLYRQITQELIETKPVKIDLGKTPLSASSLEQYWQCPFKFLASYGFALRDDSDLEVEPTPQMRGQIMHAAVERINKEGLESWNEEKIINLIDELGEVQRQVTSDVWPSTRARLVRQLVRFIEFEKIWKKTYPLSQVAGLEVYVKGFIKKEGEGIKLSVEPGEHNFYPFRGRIDRVDMNALGQAVVIDYKDKAFDLHHIRSWAKNGNFQLALYSQALENGFSDLKVKDVVGAFYYSLKNLNRDKGFLTIEHSSQDSLAGFLPEEAPKNSKVDDQTLKKYFEEINSQVFQALDGIENTEMTPNPKKESVCDSCSWDKLCRARHLL